MLVRLKPRVSFPSRCGRRSCWAYSLTYHPLTSFTQTQPSVAEWEGGGNSAPWSGCDVMSGWVGCLVLVWPRPVAPVVCTASASVCRRVFG